MGVGDWLSTAAEVDMAKRERKREEWYLNSFILKMKKKGKPITSSKEKLVK